MPKIDCNALSAIWQMLLSETASKESVASRFVKRRSKMTGELFVQTLVLGSIERPDASLTDFIKVSADLGVTITAPGLDQRINQEAVVMMQELLQATVAQCRGPERGTQEVFRQFQAVHILDSSHISLPDGLESLFRGLGGKGPVAGAKMHTSYEYLSGELSALQLVDGRQSDRKCRLHCQLAVPGSLHLFDLGFYDQAVFAALDRQGAFFVSRLHPNAALYWQKEDRSGFDMVTFLNTLSADQNEFQAIIGSREKQTVRVLAQRLPPEQAAERRRKAKKRRRRAGKTASSRLLALQDWQLFITNIPQQMLSFQQLLLAYRVRWQIELIFKLWKSQAKLATMGNWRRERVLCQLYARLIAVLLFHRLIAPLRFLSPFELSLPKAFRSLQRHTLSVIQAIADGWHNLPSIFERLERDFMQFASKDKRTKSPSTYRLLCLAEL